MIGLPRQGFLCNSPSYYIFHKPRHPRFTYIFYYIYIYIKGKPRKKRPGDFGVFPAESFCRRRRRHAQSTPLVSAAMGAAHTWARFGQEAVPYGREKTAKPPYTFIGKLFSEEVVSRKCDLKLRHLLGEHFFL